MAFIPEGLVLHHKYTGQTVQRRGTIIDRSGNGNDGTVFGAPALSFDEVNDKAVVATPWDVLGGHRYAWWAFKIKPSVFEVRRCVYHSDWNGSAGTNKIYLSLEPSQSLRLNIY